MIEAAEVHYRVPESSSQSKKGIPLARPFSVKLRFGSILMFPRSIDVPAKRNGLRYAVFCGFALISWLFLTGVTWSVEKANPVGTHRVQRNVHFAEPDGVRLRADLYVPDGEGPFPGVLMIHGGGWMSGSKAQMLTQSRRLANLGYVVMSINYRLAPQHKFPAQIHDCKAAVRWMRRWAEEYHLDSTRIAAYGYSAGGHLACLLGTTDSSSGLEGVERPETELSTRVQAVVAGGAPCDFRFVPPDAKLLAYWLHGTRRAQPAIYRQASPLPAADSEDPPAFFFHGERDWIVPPYCSQRMESRLSELGIETGYYICPGKGHVGAFLDGQAMAAAEAFLDRVLKP